MFEVDQIMKRIINKNYESFRLMTESKWDNGESLEYKKNSHFINFKYKKQYFLQTEMISKL